ncbi:MAG: hypothetical protein HY908_31450, partial [Myxococcales bacterium]|nr:hypothetical protein [Myxococcales bacterium]
MQALLDHPVILIALGAVLLGLLVAALVVSRRRRGAPRAAEAAIDKALASGKYGEAAGIALSVGRVDAAIDYYMRGQQPLTAAKVAARAGKARVAAESFERGEDFEQAARWYVKAGMDDKAVEMRRLAPVAPRERLPEPDAAPATATGSIPAEGPLDLGDLDLGPGASGVAPATLLSPDGAPPTLNDEGSPSARAERLERSFRDKVGSAGADELRRLGTDAAEALLAVGLIRQAADVYRDADLVDEAIHLYVNLLGAPGEAAPLVARRGNHERAAELYELAGMKERAAAAWCTVGAASSQPETYYARIAGLSHEVAFRYLEDGVAQRPLGRDTAELHYLLAAALEERGASARALELLATIERELGAFK